MPFGGGAKCGLCAKTVYMNEEVKFNSQSWHKLCFKCSGCSKLLEVGAAVDHGSKNYCKNCHSKNFGTSGYGHGVGAGVLSTDNGGGQTNRAAAQPTARSTPAAQATASYNAFRAQNAQRTQTTMGAAIGGGGNKCPRCGKAVYHAEKLTALSRDWHKTCFKCADCKKSLEPGNFGDNEGEVYCRGCYGRKFGPKGVGYGVGAGVLST